MLNDSDCMKTITIPFLLRGLYGKRTVSVTEAEHRYLKACAEKEGIPIGEAWHRRQRNQSTQKQNRSAKEVVNDALLKFPDDCPDMRSVEGEPTLRICRCPNSERPIRLSENKGRCIVDDPSDCCRCRGLGYRKGEKPYPSQVKAKIVKNDPDKRWCPRDRQWFFYGKKNCVRCFWSPTECKVKKEALNDV